MTRHILPKISLPMLFTWPGTVHPELVEGYVAKPFMLRQAQHERLNPQRPYNCGPISNATMSLVRSSCQVRPPGLVASLISFLGKERDLSYKLPDTRLQIG